MIELDGYELVEVDTGNVAYRSVTEPIHYLCARCLNGSQEIESILTRQTQKRQYDTRNNVYLCCPNCGTDMVANRV